MVVDREEGQSIIEFVLMLPMLVGMTLILLNVNMAIQASIVDQQYSRAQILYLAYNNAFYPTVDKHPALIGAGSNQMVVGVSDNPSEDGYTPQAQTQLIARSKKIQGSNEPKAEPNARAIVRIRNSVTLCTPTLGMRGQIALYQETTQNNFYCSSGNGMNYEQ